MTSENSELYCFIAMVRLEVNLVVIAGLKDLPPIKSAAFLLLISYFWLRPDYILGGFCCDILASVIFEEGGKFYWVFLWCYTTASEYPPIVFLVVAPLHIVPWLDPT